MWQNRLVQLRIETLVADDAHAVATWGRTFIQIWRGAPTGPKSQRVNQLAMTFVEASPVKATSLFIVEAKSPSPDDATRRNFATFSRDIACHMALAVVVSEGGGFRGALVRAVGAALTTLLPHRQNFKFVDNVDIAAQLIAPHMVPGSGGPVALARVAEEVRAKIGESIGGEAKQALRR